MGGLFQVQDQKIKVNKFKPTKPQCSRCGLYSTVKTPNMKVHGKGKKGVLVLGEAPGPQEDLVGEQFVGDVGRFLSGTLAKYGFDLNRDAYKYNTLSCFPGRSPTGQIETPTKEQIEYCRMNVLSAIKSLTPTYIWVLGKSALTALLGGYFKNLSPTLWRGFVCADQRFNAYVLPMYHPSYVKRLDKHPHLRSIFERDIENAVKLTEIGKRPKKWSEKIITLTQYEDVVGLLRKILREKDYVAFDYETTGIKPHRPGHKIVTMSFCFDDETAYAFPFQYQKHWVKKELQSIKEFVIKILTDPEIPKIAQNRKFEQIWSYFILGIDVKGMDFDTMLAARVLDSRVGTAGLDFRTYVHMGILPYDQEIAVFKKAHNGEFNRMNEAPLLPMLKYNARDSLYTFRLADILPKEIDKDSFLWGGYDQLEEVTSEFLHLEKTGFVADEEYYEKKEEELTKEISELQEKLKNSKGALQFKKKYGRSIDFNSNQDVGILIYEILKIPAVKTDKGSYAVDKAAIETSGVDFGETLIKLRQLTKIKGTYFAQFKREVVDGKIYPIYSLTTTATYRSSSEKPNAQNIPSHEEYAKKMCRSGIVAPKDYYLLEWDYSGIEVATSCMYHHDTNMIRYVSDESTNMHRDISMDLWMLSKEEMTTTIRFYGKNCWTFPQFYGSYYENCAKNLWDNCKNLKTASGVPLLKHLEKVMAKKLERKYGKPFVGYKLRYDDFVDHCQDVENDFWGRRFKHYGQWRKDISNFFKEHGYIENYFGFKCRGTLSAKDTSNHQIQGTAAHILMWVLRQVGLYLRKHEMKSHSVGQIHDSGITYVHKTEKGKVIRIINEIGTVRVREKFSWINVPLKIDYEITPLEGTWYEKKEIEKDELKRILKGGN